MLRPYEKRIVRAATGEERAVWPVFERCSSSVTAWAYSWRRVAIVRAGECLLVAARGALTANSRRA